jgi:four helix bundle protein
MSKPKKPIARSRMWQDPKGYQYLGVWQNAALLRVLVRKFTLTLPLDFTLHKPLEYRLKAQLDDAARSVKRNIEEGWKRPTTKEYLEFLGFSQASLEEVAGDIRDAVTDGFLPSVSGSSLKGTIGIDLRVPKGPQKGAVKGEPTDPHHPYFQPLSTLDPHALTSEIFTELIEKTDWLLRKLVESLEEKQQQEKKFYLVEQARLKGIAKGV